MAVIKSGASTDQLSIDPISKAARVTLYDTAGVGLVSEGGVNSNTNKTIYTVSSLNSTTTQLASSATFPGFIESVLSTTNVQVQIVCDQPYTVNILQYSDAVGTKLIGTKTFTRQAGVPTSETLMLPSDYYKITLTNNGASTTTTLSIITTLGNLPVTPVGLTNTGNFPVETPSKATYSASTIIPLVTAINANVPFINIIGSATKTIIVKKISINGHTLTAVAYTTVNVDRLSTASTGGTSTTLVSVPLDSSTSTATAIVKAYTVAPTRGTLTGVVSSRRVLSQATIPVAGGMTANFDFQYGDLISSSGIVLRGVVQEICLSYPVVLASAATCAIYIEWTEE